MKNILYIIFYLFLLRSIILFQEGKDVIFLLISLLFCSLGIFYLSKKYEDKYISFALIPLLIIFMLSH